MIIDDALKDRFLSRTGVFKGGKALQTGRESLANREKGTFRLVVIARPYELGRPPLYIGATALIRQTIRPNPTFKRGCAYFDTPSYTLSTYLF